MAEYVKVRFSHWWGDYKPKDEAMLEKDTAAALVRDGIVRPATVVDARKADVPEDTAATRAPKK